MKIVRIGSDRSVDIEANCIDVELNGVNYRLTETNEGKISINKADYENDHGIEIFPLVTNVIEIR